MPNVVDTKYEKTFNSQVSLNFDKATRTFSLVRDENGKFGSDDAEGILATCLKYEASLIESGDDKPVFYDKWSFYIKGINQKLLKGTNLSSEAITLAMSETAEFELNVARFGKPRLDFKFSKVKLDKVKKESTIITL